ncbi:NfeD family protein [Psychromonas sp. KJ10-10]|uniref:NfeD family protein n=1 Tax=Psychromonas sp. KJ10-10 TaxID=3391823 RepID=UPI0039B5B758
MDYIVSHFPQTLIVIGLILLAIEVMVLGFSTFVLFFVGLGTIITGALMAMGLIPETLLMALLSTAVISSFIAIFAWKPMKRIQNKVEVKQIDNDMIGHQFYLSEELAIGKTITHHYSGITWQVKAKEALPAGTEVKIVKMEVGVLTVEQV